MLPGCMEALLKIPYLGHSKALKSEQLPLLSALSKQGFREKFRENTLKNN